MEALQVRPLTHFPLLSAYCEVLPTVWPRSPPT